MLTVSARILMNVFLFLCMNPLIMAQEADSLEQALQNQQMPVEEQIRILDDLSWAYMDSDMQKSVDFSKQGLPLALRSKDEKMTATFYRNIGVAYYMGSVYDSARIYLDRALPIALELEEDRLIAAIYVAYGNLYQAQSWYRGAADYYRKGVDIIEVSDNQSGLALVYSNIGAMYQNVRNYDQALKYFDRARQLAEHTGDLGALAGIHVSLSDILMTTGSPIEEALPHAQEAIRLNEEIGHDFNLCMSYLTLAKVYYYYNDFDAATPVAERAMALAEELGFPSMIAHSLVVLSNIHLYQNQYREAVRAAERVLKHDTTNANITVNAYANLAIGHAYLGHPDLTELNLDKYRKEVNRYANQEYQTSLSEMEVRFETARKELQIRHLEQQSQYYVRLGIAIGVMSLILLAFFVIRYRLAVSRRKLAEEEAKRLEQENQLIAVQATLDGEAAERSRLARDLHDGLGSMLSVVKFNLPQMDKGAALESLDVERFKRALGMLDDSIHELRRVAHHMMPESLLRFGLKASLSDFCESVPNVDFHYFGSEQRLPEKLEVLVYRCVHELVTNALKHARAEQINVQLVQEADRLSFTVQDDGIGFDQKTVTEGMGLKNIRQRVASFQGEMNVYSSGKGTEIHVELDLTRI